MLKVSEELRLHSINLGYFFEISTVELKSFLKVLASYSNLQLYHKLREISKSKVDKQ